MARRAANHVLGIVCGLLATSLLGCTSGPGKMCPLSPPQHGLLPQTKDFRSVSPAPNAPRELGAVLLPTHVVESGDVLLVQPEELDAPVRIAADQPVQPDGTIDLGSYGRPVVAGKTVPVIEAEIQQLVKAKLKPSERATINVRLINRNSKVYYVLGEVKRPGAYPITGRENALDAIIAAGGLTPKASEKNIVLSRPSLPCECRIVKPVCYAQIVQLGDTTTNYQILPGDRIYVPSKTLLEAICPKGCRKVCGPCDMPHMLCPMDRPGCGEAVECGSADCKLSLRKPSVCKSTGCKAESCEAAECNPTECGAAGCEPGGWGITGCLLGKHKLRAGPVKSIRDVIVIEPEAQPLPTPPKAER